MSTPKLWRLKQPAASRNVPELRELALAIPPLRAGGRRVAAGCRSVRLLDGIGGCR
jgi:hypothetical protein